MAGARPAHHVATARLHLRERSHPAASGHVLRERRLALDQVTGERRDAELPRREGVVEALRTRAREAEPRPARRDRDRRRRVGERGATGCDDEILRGAEAHHVRLARVGERVGERADPAAISGVDREGALALDYVPARCAQPEDRREHVGHTGAHGHAWEAHPRPARVEGDAGRARRVRRVDGEGPRRRADDRVALEGERAARRAGRAPARSRRRPRP